MTLFQICIHFKKEMTVSFILFFVIISVGGVFKILQPFPFVFQYLVSSDGFLPYVFWKGNWNFIISFFWSEFVSWEG